MKILARIFHKRHLAKLAQDIDAALAKRKADRLAGYIPVNASKRRAG